jgi:hypothetical protein
MDVNFRAHLPTIDRAADVERASVCSTKPEARGVIDQVLATYTPSIDRSIDRSPDRAGYVALKCSFMIHILNWALASTCSLDHWSLLKGLQLFPFSVCSLVLRFVCMLVACVIACVHSFWSDLVLISLAKSIECSCLIQFCHKLVTCFGYHSRSTYVSVNSRANNTEIKAQFDWLWSVDQVWTLGSNGGEATYLLDIFNGDVWLLRWPPSSAAILLLLLLLPLVVRCGACDVPRSTQALWNVSSRRSLFGRQYLPTELPSSGELWLQPPRPRPRGSGTCSLDNFLPLVFEQNLKCLQVMFKWRCRHETHVVDILLGGN